MIEFFNQIMGIEFVNQYMNLILTLFFIIYFSYIFLCFLSFIILTRGNNKFYLLAISGLLIQCVLLFFIAPFAGFNKSFIYDAKLEEDLYLEATRCRFVDDTPTCDVREFDLLETGSKYKLIEVEVKSFEKIPEYKINGFY